MGNKSCPSYDCEYCNTYPLPYLVKCGSSETKNCKWLNFDFEKTNYSQYMKEQKGRK